MLPAQPLSVLVIDDDVDTCESLAQLFAHYGHAVRTATNWEQAVTAAHAFAPDIAIVDIGLRGMDGYATARSLCKSMAHRPLLIAYTGYPGLEAVSRSEGFDHHLLKPFEPTIFCDLLSHYADRLASHKVCPQTSDCLETPPLDWKQPDSAGFDGPPL